MGCGICKGNANCSPLIYAVATYKHMVSCGEFSETRSFRGLSVTFGRSIMNNTGDYNGV